MRRVIDGGPWTVDGMAVPMERWRKDCRPEDMELRKVQVWVQVYNTPVHLIEEGVAGDLAGMAGKVCGPLSQEHHEVMRCKFIRCRVELDINEPIRAGFFLRCPEGGPIWIAFKYERLPVFCYKCGVLNHETSDCAMGGGNGKFGRWMRADNEEFKMPEEEEVGREGRAPEVDGMGGVASNDMTEDGSGGRRAVVQRERDVWSTDERQKSVLAIAEVESEGRAGTSWSEESGQQETISGQDARADDVVGRKAKGKLVTDVDRRAGQKTKDKLIADVNIGVEDACHMEEGDSTIIRLEGEEDAWLFNGPVKERVGYVAKGKKTVAGPLKGLGIRKLGFKAKMGPTTVGRKERLVSGKSARVEVDEETLSDDETIGKLLSAAIAKRSRRAQ